MMRLVWNLRQRWRNYRCPPAVVLSRSGQCTQRPQVHVSVASIRGSQSVYTFNADDQGEASAQMYGRSLADIAGLRLIDNRK